MRNEFTTPLVTDALDMAFIQRRPDLLIHQSERRSQYTSSAFGNRCHQASIAIAVGCRGDPYDNAVAESFFAALDRTPRPTHLPHPKTTPAQPPSTTSKASATHVGALSHRIPLTHGLRREPPTTLWTANREASIRAGQLQSILSTRPSVKGQMPDPAFLKRRAWGLQEDVGVSISYAEGKSVEEGPNVRLDHDAWPVREVDLHHRGCFHHSCRPSRCVAIREPVDCIPEEVHPPRSIAAHSVAVVKHHDVARNYLWRL
ncbi:MAG: DDE-type integrase/transposase/recombinase [Acidimicrobiia bacterium]|nr:DDE-type integrase/transposase/recombinase [Acidimicrobiia bacterium]